MNSTLSSPRRQKAAMAAGLVIALGLAAVPMLVSSAYVLALLTLCFIYALWAASWDFMSGLTGRENFGFSLFIGASGYVAALTDTVLGMPLWFAMPMSILSAVIFALLIGLPTLRLKGPYFALAMMIAAAIAERLAYVLWEIFGGQEGITGLHPLTSSPMLSYYVTLVAAGVSLLLLLKLAHSDLGLVLRAIQGDEAGCMAAGLNVTHYKVAALLISAAFAGLGGVMYAHVQQHVNPQMLSIDLTITIIILAYVGGLGSIYGPAVSAVLLTMLIEGLRGFGPYRLWIYAVILLGIVFFLPKGVIAPLWQRWTGRKP